MVFDIDQSFIEDLRYYARDVGMVELGDVTVSGFSPWRGMEYENALTQAFHFLRRHDNGRYSSTAKMRVLNAASTAEQARISGIDAALRGNEPGVILLERPFNYDEETEVKSGGLLGALIYWPEDDGRVMLAVHQEARRQRYGSLMVFVAQRTGASNMTSWVAPGNAEAMHFMLTRGFRPDRTNRQGGIAWVYGRGVNNAVDGTEDGVDPLDLLDPRRQRAVLRQRQASRSPF